jgi:hypothetical protein
MPAYNSIYPDNSDSRRSCRIQSSNGRVVVVLDRGKCADGWDNGDYRTGFMIEFDIGARLLPEESEGRLELVRPTSSDGVVVIEFLAVKSQ